MESMGIKERFFGNRNDAVDITVARKERPRRNFLTGTAEYGATARTRGGETHELTVRAKDESHAKEKVAQRRFRRWLNTH